jgi:predicted dehydrogenase
VIQVAVVGLGRVGSQYEADGVPRSHVACVLATPGLALAAVIDPSESARATFRQQWGALAMPRVLDSVDALAAGEADVIALCTPMSDRVAVVGTAVQKGSKLLVIEKPLASSVGEAQAIASVAETRAVPVRVNFQRRFDPHHRALRQALPGVPRHAVMRYGKGLFNYGSHLVDLLIDWFGPIGTVQALSSVGRSDDPDLTFVARMQVGFDAILIGMDGLSYDQFEVDLFYDECRIEIANGGTEMRRYDVVADRYYKGYAQLGPASTIGSDGPVGGLAEFYRAVSDHLASGTALPGCDAREAIAGLEVLHAARESARRGGCEISLITSTSL